MNQYFMRITGRIMRVSMLSFSLPFQTVQAAMIGVDKVAVTSVQGQLDRERVLAFVEREDVSKALQQQGVEASAARARVEALTDDEVSQLAGKLDQLPAGGDVLSILFAVFIILLVTDILGFTKVFPFTRSIK